MAVSCIEPGKIMAKMCKNARTDLATCNNGPAWNTQTGNTAAAAEDYREAGCGRGLTNVCKWVKSNLDRKNTVGLI